MMLIHHIYIWKYAAKVSLPQPIFKFQLKWK